MFVEAIKKVSEFTRPIHTITKNYNNDLVVPGASTLFFVNELGVAVTCKHVAGILAQTENIKNNYALFKKEFDELPSSKKFKRRLRDLEKKYNYENNVVTHIENLFVDCVDKFDNFNIISHPNPIYDLAIIKFNGFTNLNYNNYAIFLKDEDKIQQGKSLCRLGYPFPEFKNYVYDKERDEIKWTSEGQVGTPKFPIDGIITRNLLNEEGHVFGIEISTPGLKGQSGGPLFDVEGKIYGMQCSTHHLHLGFDVSNAEINIAGKNKKISNHPFLHLGNCLRVNIIKSFLRDNNIKFYEG